MVLVTGASGFLGGRLVQLLVEGGSEVRLLARSTASLTHLDLARIEVIRGSLEDSQAASEAIRGVTHIYHCAACSTDWAPWSTYLAANVTGVANLLAAAKSSSILERFLHVSTTDVYGYPESPCDESHPLIDTGLPYNRSKVLGERLVWDSGVPFTVVRPANIYGPRGKAFVTDIAKLIGQGIMAVIDRGVSQGGFCYVDNVARAIIQAALSRATLGRAYNIAEGNGVTWREYVDRFADGLGRRRPWINLPTAMAMPLARTMELVRLPLLTRHAVYLLSRNQEFPTERARSDFGFAPAVSFEQGMALTLDWSKQSS